MTVNIHNVLRATKGYKRLRALRKRGVRRSVQVVVFLEATGRN